MLHLEILSKESEIINIFTDVLPSVSFTFSTQKLNWHKSRQQCKVPA